MAYFLVKTEMIGSIPQVMNWFQKMSPQDITPERAGNIPKWTRLPMKSGTIFPDVLTIPSLLVSSMVHGVLRLYDPQIQYKRIVLFEKGKKGTVLYHLPILPDCDCLLPESELSIDKSEILRGVIDLEKTGRCPLIKLGGVTTSHVAFRLDVVESLLRRDAKGFKLTELEIR